MEKKKAILKIKCFSTTDEMLLLSAFEEEPPPPERGPRSSSNPLFKELLIWVEENKQVLLKDMKSGSKRIPGLKPWKDSRSLMIMSTTSVLEKGIKPVNMRKRNKFVSDDEFIEYAKTHTIRDIAQKYDRCYGSIATIRHKYNITPAKKTNLKKLNPVKQFCLEKLEKLTI